MCIYKKNQNKMNNKLYKLKRIKVGIVSNN